MRTLSAFHKPPRGALLLRSHPLARHLAGCWLLNEGTGERVYDSSGNFAHGAMVGIDGTTAWQAGPRGSTLYLAGDDYINLGNPKSLQLPELTICGWVKTTDAGYLYSGRSTTSGSAAVYLNGPVALLVGSNFPVAYSDTAVDDGAWHFIAVSFRDSDNEVRYYLDGVTDGVSTNTVTQNHTVEKWIGQRVGGTSGFSLVGHIENVMVFNRVLEAEDVRWLYLEPYTLFASRLAVSIAGAETASGAVTVAAITVDGTAGVERDSTGAVTVPAVTVSGTATVSRDATGAVTVAAVTVSGSASFSTPGAGRSRRATPFQKPPRGTLVNRTHPLARGLAGAWLLNEGTGEIAADSSGNGNHGALSGFDATTAWTGGPRGSVLTFDGTDDYIDLGNRKHLQLVDQTICGWLKTTDATGYLWSSRDDAGGGASVYLSSEIELLVGTNFPTEDSIGTIDDGEWHFIAVTFRDSDNQVKYYIDGVLDHTAANTISPTHTVDKLIGFRVSGDAAHYLAADIESVMAFNRILSDEDVRWLYKEPYALFVSPRIHGVVGGESASGAVEVAAVTVSGAAELSRDSTGAVDVPAVVVSGTASVSRDATGAVTTGAVTVSGTATLAGEETASGAVVLASVTVAGAAEISRPSSGAVDIAAVVVAGQATVARDATGNVTIGAATVDATGAVSRPSSGAVTIGAVTVSGTAAVSRDATGSVTVPAITVDGSASSLAGKEATGAVTVAAVTVSGSASVSRTATGAVTIPATTVSGTVNRSYDVTGAVTVPAVQASGTAVYILAFIYITVNSEIQKVFEVDSEIRKTHTVNSEIVKTFAVNSTLEKT